MGQSSIANAALGKIRWVFTENKCAVSNSLSCMISGRNCLLGIKMNIKTALPYGKAMMAMFCWSITFVWIKIALIWYHPIEIVLLRLVLASALLFIVMLVTRHTERIQKKDFLQFMLVAFCEPFCYFIGEANGMQYVSSTLGSLIISIIPIVTAFGAWLLLKEKITPSLIIGLVVSFAGVTFLSLQSTDLHATFKGVLFLLLAVISGMFYGIVVKGLTMKYRTLTIVTWQSFFGLIYFIPVFMVTDFRHFSTMQHSGTGLLTIAAMSLFASVGAFMLFTGVIRELGVIKSNIFTNLIPVFTVILAYLILRDVVTVKTMIGLVLTIVGLLISQLKDLRRLTTYALGSQNRS